MRGVNLRASGRGAARKGGLARRKRSRGQAMVETVLLTMLLIGWGSAMVFFFPDSLNALQIYMDSFYFVLSSPVP